MVYKRERERVKSEVSGLWFTDLLTWISESQVRKKPKHKTNLGFTLIELLIVIAIIGLLSSVVLASLNSARSKSRDARRVTDIKQVQLALELFFDNNNSYPVAAAWFGGQGNCWGTVTNDWVPGLSPNYIPTLPLDPRPTNCNSVYLYAGNATDYKIIAHVPENCENPAMRSIKDPTRDGGASASIVDGNSCWAWALYTSGAAAW